MSPGHPLRPSPLRHSHSLSLTKFQDDALAAELEPGALHAPTVVLRRPPLGGRTPWVVACESSVH